MYEELQEALEKLTKHRNRLKTMSRSSVNIATNKITQDNIQFGGKFNIQCFDESGNLKWKEHTHNLWVNAGRNYVLDVLFKAATRKDPLYVGLSQTTTPAAGWSMGNAGGATWTEFTGFQDNRKEFVDSAISSYRVDNTASKATFTVSAAGTVFGAFMVTTATTKGGTSGILLCASNFASSREVQSSDEVRVTYTVGADDDGV